MFGGGRVMYLDREQERALQGERGEIGRAHV